MVLYSLRVLWLLLRHAFKPAIDPREELLISFRAWPWYCDLNLHMNNAHFLTFFEYARWAHTLRAGFLRRVFAERVEMLVAGVSMIYRRPLPWFRRFTVRTRIAAVDDRWIYFLQEILDARGRIAARAIVRGQARKSAAAISPREVLGVDFPNQLPPAELEAFKAVAEQHLKQLS
jgi:YbgC/YbaW family acyl-CoA thioester hydrolase